uniref:Nuclear receptor subfamily 1, group D, member 2a n=1 Tax=Nothobranchius rachovii TaxID=451742 RepID=A0A1A8NFD7_9TELE
MPEDVGTAKPGGVIAYISSSSASTSESCVNSGYASASPAVPRSSLPSRAVGMVVDIAPPAKRGPGSEKTGRSTTSTKCSITKINGMVLLCKFAKKIPGFRDLSEHDQVSLLKAGTFEVLMVRFASLFNMAEQTVTFLSGKQYSLGTLRSLGAGELLNSMCEFSEKLAALRLNQDEMSLFTAVVLVSADHSGIQNLNSVEALQDKLIWALRNLVMQNHGDESATTFTKLLLKLPELRSLNNMHSEELLSFKVHP